MCLKGRVPIIDESEHFQAKMPLLRKTSVSYVFGGREKEVYLFSFGVFACVLLWHA